jgi:hypothetical protein
MRSKRLAEIKRREFMKAAALAIGVAGGMRGQETLPVGPTREDQQRNAVLLGEYDYAKYAESLTGFTGQDLQRIACVQWKHAVRTRVGPRGTYKAGMARRRDGKLAIAACRMAKDAESGAARFYIHVYESPDDGLTWQEIGQTRLYGKEPTLTVLPSGTLVLTAEGGHAPEDKPGLPADLPISRSEDGGRTWETRKIPGPDIPRNLIVEPDGTLLLVRALDSGWYHRDMTLAGGGSPNLQLCRSRDEGRTWQFSEGAIDWDWPAFGEVSSLRRADGKYLATLRRQIPGTQHEGFEDTVVTESLDGGKHWAKPWRMSSGAEVHAYLTQLNDGRILATYSNYHLPWGSCAIVSQDAGKTWDVQHPIQLAFSADLYVGWAVTLQLPDNSLITSYATTSYYKQEPDRTTCEVVRWQLP